MDSVRYDLVSQGILIDSLTSRKQAIAYCKVENRAWLKYCQRCYDREEEPADNEVEVYEVINDDIAHARLIYDSWGEVL